MDLYGDLPPAADDGKESGKSSGWARPNANLVPKRTHATTLAPSNAFSVINCDTKLTHDKSGSLKPINLVPSSTKAPSKVAFKPRQAASVNPPASIGSNQTITGLVQKSSPEPNNSTSALNITSPVAVESVATFEVDDPYDPAKPNDYLAWCEERLERKRRARIEEENKRTIAESERKRASVDKERADATQKGDVERLRELQSVGRGRGRGLSNLPAWMTAASTTTASSSESKEEHSNTSQSIQETPEFTIGGRFEDSEEEYANELRREQEDGGAVAQRLMSRMGYREGSGLGRSGQGITKPVEHRKSGPGGQGVVSLDPTDAKRFAEPQFDDRDRDRDRQTTGPSSALPSATTSLGKRKVGMFSNPTSVILLKNMVAPGEQGPNLAAETEQECLKYGPVRRCAVFDASNSFPNCPAEESIRTFVAFEKQESAVRAFRDLNGRFFAGRQISASFFDESRFEKNDLTPLAGEW